jgi:hypothetical protein
MMPLSNTTSSSFGEYTVDFKFSASIRRITGFRPAYNNALGSSGDVLIYAASVYTDPTAGIFPDMPRYR